MLLVSTIRNGGEGRVLGQEQKGCAALTKTSTKNDNNNELLDAQEDMSHKCCEQKERMVKELSNELSSLKESNTELISMIQDLELDKESARISSNAIMSAMEETYEKEREQQERIVKELSDEVSKLKESNTELILKIQDLELDIESARISSNAIMSAMEETYEKEREKHERMVQEFSNKLSSVQESNKELILKTQDLELDKESARISSNAIMSAMEETYEKELEQHERIVIELSDEISKLKESNTELILKIQDLELDKESARISNNVIMSGMEETYEKDRKKQDRIVQELRNELSRVKESNTEFISKIRELQLDKESARLSNDAIMSAIQENYETDQEQTAKEVEELTNQLLGAKKSITQLNSNIKDLELCIETSRISHDAVINGIEEHFEEGEDYHRAEVQLLQDIIRERGELLTVLIAQFEATEAELRRTRNELAASKETYDAEIATLKNELERQKSNYFNVYNCLVEETCNRLKSVKELKSIFDEFKKNSDALEEERALSDEEFENIQGELKIEKRNRSKAEELVVLLTNKVTQKDEEINELTARLRRKRGLRGLISCCF